MIAEKITLNELKTKLKELIQWEKNLVDPAYSYPSQAAHKGGHDAIKKQLFYGKGGKAQVQEYHQKLSLFISQTKPKFTDIIDIFEGFINLLKAFRLRMETITLHYQISAENLKHDATKAPTYNRYKDQGLYGRSQLLFFSKKINFFSVLKVLGFLELVHSSVTKKAQSSLIMIGPTQSGKGTLINFLVEPKNLKILTKLGCYRITKKDELKNKKFTISHKFVSDTIFPENQVFNNMQIFDTGGFEDTRGSHDNVSNILALQHVLNLPQAKKIALCFNFYCLLGQKAGDFLTTVENLIGSIGLNVLLNNTCLIFTRARCSAEGIKEALKEMVAQNENISEQVKRVLTKWSDKSGAVGIFSEPKSEVIDEKEQTEILSMIEKLVKPQSKPIYLNPQVLLGSYREVFFDLYTAQRDQLKLFQTNHTKSLSEIEAKIEKVKLNEKIDKEALLKVEIDQLKAQIDKVVFDPLLSEKTGSKRLYCQFLDKIKISPDKLQTLLDSIMNVITNTKVNLTRQLQAVEALMKSAIVVENGLNNLEQSVKNLLTKEIHKNNPLNGPAALPAKLPLVPQHFWVEELTYKKFVVLGRTVKISQMLKQVKKLRHDMRVFAQTIILDADLDTQKQKIWIPKLVFICNTFKIVGNRLINLKGQNCQVDLGVAKSCSNLFVQNNGANAQWVTKCKADDGVPGLPGGNGGHLYLKYEKQQNIAALTVNISGGKGGKGQNGGNGWYGNFQIHKDYRRFFKPGAGGKGGFCGNPGFIYPVGVQKNIKIIKDSIDGPNGAGGYGNNYDLGENQEFHQGCLQQNPTYGYNSFINEKNIQKQKQPTLHEKIDAQQVEAHYNQVKNDTFLKIANFQKNLHDIMHAYNKLVLKNHAINEMKAFFSNTVPATLVPTKTIVEQTFKDQLTKQIVDQSTYFSTQNPKGQATMALWKVALEKQILGFEGKVKQFQTSRRASYDLIFPKVGQLQVIRLRKKFETIMNTYCLEK